MELLYLSLKIKNSHICLLFSYRDVKDVDDVRDNDSEEDTDSRLD